MKSYMLLISFIGLFTCSFNIAAMGGPEATYLPFDLEEENVTATADPRVTYLSFDLDEEGETSEDSLEKGIASLPQELQEIVIIKTLDSMLKEQLPKEKAELSTFVRRYLALLRQPLLRRSNRRYFLNRLAHKFFLTFGKHLKVPDWYLIKYFGEPGKEYTKEEMLTLGKNILDYGFSLPERLELIERLDLKKIKVIDGKLDLSGLRLNNLEGLLKIPNITTVTYLYLHNNQLKELPQEIANLHNLQELWLHNNQLKELPQEINLPNLQTLWLHNNQLKELPQEINLPNLQELWLHNNQLKELPKEIANLPNLQALYLHNNQLKELPKEIANLHNLQTLWLSGNQYLKNQEARIRRMLPKVKIEF